MPSSNLLTSNAICMPFSPMVFVSFSIAWAIWANYLLAKVTHTIITCMEQDELDDSECSDVTFFFWSLTTETRHGCTLSRHWIHAIVTALLHFPILASTFHYFEGWTFLPPLKWWRWPTYAFWQTLHDLDRCSVTVACWAAAFNSL